MINTMKTKGTNAMLEAVAKAATQEWSLEFEKSRRLGLNTERLTLEQAPSIRLAIEARQAKLIAGTKAA